MGNRYLVVSDLHFADIEEHADGWKAYKSARFAIDEPLSDLIARFVADGEAAGATSLTLVLNGDIIDFDVVTATPETPPWPLRRDERKRGLHPTEEKSIWKLRRILADHPLLIRTLGDFIARGHRIVYVMGNHDREFHFASVQRAFVEVILGAASESTRDAIRFEPWFFYVPDEIYVEHGQQYDFYSSFRYILSPVVETSRGTAIALPMGNLSGRLLASQMGYFNPYTHEFILNFFSYITHWFRHYAFSKHSLIWNWFIGSLLVVFRLFRQKKKIHERPADYDKRLDEAARRAGIPRATLDALGDLHRQPITTRFFRILREFWIDRLLIAIAMTAGTIALGVVNIPLWIQLVVPFCFFPLVYFVYEWLAKGENVMSVDHVVPGYAAKIAALLGVKVVTFGHTHHPRLVPLAKNVSFVDTGTWAPMTSAKEPNSLTPGYRNYLTVAFGARGPEVFLGSWLS